MQYMPVHVAKEFLTCIQVLPMLVLAIQAILYLQLTTDNEGLQPSVGKDAMEICTPDWLSC